MARIDPLKDVQGAEVLLVFEFFEGFDDVFALLGQNVRPGQEAIIECQFRTLDVL